MCSIKALLRASEASDPVNRLIFRCIWAKYALMQFQTTRKSHIRMQLHSASNIHMYCMYVTESCDTGQCWLTSSMVSIMGERLEALTLMLSSFSRTSVSPASLREMVFSSWGRGRGTHVHGRHSEVHHSMITFRTVSIIA